jgi:hypothetical protein
MTFGDGNALVPKDAAEGEDISAPHQPAVSIRMP